MITAGTMFRMLFRLLHHKHSQTWYFRRQSRSLWEYLTYAKKKNENRFTGESPNINMEEEKYSRTWAQIKKRQTKTLHASCPFILAPFFANSTVTISFAVSLRQIRPHHQITHEMSLLAKQQHKKVSSLPLLLLGVFNVHFVASWRTHIILVCVVYFELILWQQLLTAFEVHRALV